VNLSYCESNGIPVLRRCTGGGTVLQGPGCLNYSLVLRIGDSGPLQSISSTNKHILGRHQATLTEALGKEVEMCGQTDLAIGGLKFSGNAQRRKRQCLIFHGSFLLDFDMELIAKVLPMPSKQPEYRRQRAHGDFLMNLGVPAERIKRALRGAWKASETLAQAPFERIEALAREKYGREMTND
jgi:lipoate-protein ligase A